MSEQSARLRERLASALNDLLDRLQQPSVLIASVVLANAVVDTLIATYLPQSDPHIIALSKALVAAIIGFTPPTVNKIQEMRA